MKKLGKLGIAAFTFASIANKSLAVDQAGGSASMGIADMAPFALGALLIVAVLFIGYKMDKASENMPTMRREKAPKKSKGKRAKEEYTPAEEAEIYAEENNADMPYEEDENEYYETDSSFDDLNGLNEETEYEEDDVSLFSTANDTESSFNDIDDNISYDVEEPAAESVVEQEEEEPITDYSSNFGTVEPESSFGGFESKSMSTEENLSFDSTMIFDSNNLTSAEPEISATDDFEYSAPVEGLDEKIDGLDDLDDFESSTLAETTQKPEDTNDSQSFMNELNKYKEEAEEEEDFAGFTTTKSTKSVEEDDLFLIASDKTTSSIIRIRIFIVSIVFSAFSTPN